jgi:hypothetical protein
MSTLGRAGVFMFDRHAETMPRKALTALQTSRVKETMERAYALAPYRKKFDAAGVRAHDFKSLADIGRFPFTLKSDLRDNYPFGMFAVPRESLLRTGVAATASFGGRVVGDRLRCDRAGDVRSAVRAMKSRAVDFIEKRYSREALPSLFRRRLPASGVAARSRPSITATVIEIVRASKGFAGFSFWHCQACVV